MKGDGFTIIEVMLFLAISAMLMTMAIIGSGEMAKRTRFTASVDGLHSTIQRQYEEIVSGVNSRGPLGACAGANTYGVPGTGNCLLLGRVLTMSGGAPAAANTVMSRYITAVPQGEDGSVLQNIQRASNMTVRNANSQDYELPWGATIRAVRRIDGGPQPTLVNNIAFIRDPKGSQIMPFYFNSPSSDVGNVRSALLTALTDSDASSTTATTAICIENTQDWPNNSPMAAIVFSPGRGASTIDTNYSPSRGPGGLCPW